jgi:predicted MPP superfamily phosphohydrolase
MRRRAFLARIIGGSAVGVGTCAAYAWSVEPHWPEVVHLELPVESLPDRLEGAVLVQISDLHVGRDVDDAYLTRCLRTVRGLAPDLLALTGDLVSVRDVDDGLVFGKLARVLAHLPPTRHGTFAVLGNHDYGRAWSHADVAARVSGELERRGVRVLRNACARVEGLDVVGVDDLWARRADPRRALGLRTGGASLVLCHNPDALDELDWAGYRGWVLAGHTHGGQCRPPFLPPPILPVRNRRYAAGVVHLADGRSLYVNRGLGHLQRVRFNVRPEITAFTFRRARPGAAFSTPAPEPR